MPVKRSSRTEATTSPWQADADEEITAQLKVAGIDPATNRKRIAKLIGRKSLTEAQEAELARLTDWWHEHKRQQAEWTAVDEQIAAAWEDHARDPDFVAKWKAKAARSRTAKVSARLLYETTQRVRTMEGKAIQ